MSAWEIAFSKPQGHTHKRDQHRHFNQWADDGSKRLPRADAENRHGHGNRRKLARTVRAETRAGVLAQGCVERAAADRSELDRQCARADRRRRARLTDCDELLCLRELRDFERIAAGCGRFCRRNC